MEKKRVRVPIRSAREMAVAVAADVESRKTMQRCRATLTRSVERYYAALLQDVTTHVDGQLFRVDNVHAYTECQCPLKMPSSPVCGDIIRTQNG